MQLNQLQAKDRAGRYRRELAPELLSPALPAAAVERPTTEVHALLERGGVAPEMAWPVTDGCHWTKPQAVKQRLVLEAILQSLAMDGSDAARFFSEPVVRRSKRVDLTWIAGQASACAGAEPVKLCWSHAATAR